MKKINIQIENAKFEVKVAITDEEKATGLQNINSLPLNEGMLFIADDDEGMTMWMKDTHIPLDLIFIDEDWEVIRVVEGEPLSEQLIEVEDASYVLELNIASNIQVGDYVDLSELEEEEDEEGEQNEEEKNKTIVMIVLDSNGESQMNLEGGERIFSRPNTKTLIKMARRANSKKSDSSYKALGKKIFSYIKQQDDREPDYVEVPE